MSSPMQEMKGMKNVEDLPFDEMRPEFNEQVTKFVKIVRRMAPIKRMSTSDKQSNGKDRAAMTGTGLAAMLEYVCEAFNEGKAVSIQGMWDSTSLAACEKALRIASLVRAVLCIFNPPCSS